MVNLALGITVLNKVALQSTDYFLSRTLILEPPVRIEANATFSLVANLHQLVRLGSLQILKSTYISRGGLLNVIPLTVNIFVDLVFSCTGKCKNSANQEDLF